MPQEDEDRVERVRHGASRQLPLSPSSACGFRSNWLIMRPCQLYRSRSAYVSHRQYTGMDSILRVGIRRGAGVGCGVWGVECGVWSVECVAVGRMVGYTGSSSLEGRGLGTSYGASV